MTFEWPSWVDPLSSPFPELHNQFAIGEICSFLIDSIVIVMQVASETQWDILAGDGV